MEDFIAGFGITQNKLAVSIGEPPRRINEIVHGKRGITAHTALRLASDRRGKGSRHREEPLGTVVATRRTEKLLSTWTSGPITIRSGRLAFTPGSRV